MEEKLPKLPLFLVELCLLNYGSLELPLESIDLFGATGIFKRFRRAGLLSCSVSDLVCVSEMPAPHLLGTIKAAIHRAAFYLFFGTYQAGDRLLHTPYSKGARLIWWAFCRHMHPRMKTSTENEYPWEALEKILPSVISSRWVHRQKKSWPFLGFLFSMCHLVLHLCLMAVAIGGIFSFVYLGQWE